MIILGHSQWSVDRPGQLNGVFIFCGSILAYTGHNFMLAVVTGWVISWATKLLQNMKNWSYSSIKIKCFKWAFVYYIVSHFMVDIKTNPMKYNSALEWVKLSLLLTVVSISVYFLVLMLDLVYYGIGEEAYSTGWTCTDIKITINIIYADVRRRKQKEQSGNSSYPVYIASLPEIHCSVL